MSNAIEPPKFGGNPGEPVPEVDPDDLKTLWREEHELQARHPSEQVAIGMLAARHLCKPGANIDAIGYRATFFWLMTQIAPQQFAAFTKDGVPINAAFHAAAKVPAEWMGAGVVRHSPPFDLNEFIRLCKEERDGA